MALQPDFAPLWLPADEALTEEQAAAQPADRVEGWTWGSLLMVAVVGSRSKTVSRVGALLAAVVLLVTLPTIARGNFWGLARLAVAQIVVTGVLLAVTRRTRSVSAAWTIVHWHVGFFASVIVSRIVVDLLGAIGLSGRPLHAVAAFVTLAALTAPLASAVALGHHRWHHPGVTDLLVLGSALGAGFALHEDGVLDITRGLSLGDGHPAVWMALVGFAVGLLVLERHDEVAVVVAALALLLVIGDMTVLQLRWLPSVLAIGAVGAAVLLDRRRLEDVGARDHVFPPAPEGRHDVLAARYRRLRNGMHTTIAVDGEHWPPRPDAPIAELARSARAASIDVGRETSRLGWDRNPDDRTGAGRRFFGPNGWTPFTVDADGPGESPPLSRPGATARRDAPPEPAPWKTDRTLPLIGGAVLALVVTAAFTLSLAELDTVSIATAEAGPPFVRTLLGACGAVAAAAGRARPELGPAWELGPPDHHEV